MEAIAVRNGTPCLQFTTKPRARRDLLHNETPREGKSPPLRNPPGGKITSIRNPPGGKITSTSAFHAFASGALIAIKFTSRRLVSSRQRTNDLNIHVSNAAAAVQLQCITRVLRLHRACLSTHDKSVHTRTTFTCTCKTLLAPCSFEATRVARVCIVRVYRDANVRVLYPRPSPFTTKPPVCHSQRNPPRTGIPSTTKPSRTQIAVHNETPLTWVRASHPPRCDARCLLIVA